MTMSALLPFSIMLTFGIYLAYLYWKHPLQTIRRQRKQRATLREFLGPLGDFFYKVGGGEFSDDFLGLEITMMRIISILLIVISLIGIAFSLKTLLKL